MATTTSVSGSDSITGTDGSEKLVGGAGSDTIDGGAGSDFINAGGGDDWIIYDQNDYKILGGGGIDTLWFKGTAQKLNLGTQAINGIEALLLCGFGGHSITFSAADVIRISDTDSFVITGSQTGLSGTTVRFSDLTDGKWIWSMLPDGQSQYTNGGAKVTVDWIVNVEGFSKNATIGVTGTSTVTEDETTTNDMLTASGAITVTDGNANQALLLPSLVSTPSVTTELSGSGKLSTDISTSQSRGTLTITDGNNGGYTYEYRVDNNKVQDLNQGQTWIDSFTVTSVDGTTKTLDFTINGRDENIVVNVNETNSGYVKYDNTDTVETSGTFSIGAGATSLVVTSIDKNSPFSKALTATINGDQIDWFFKVREYYIDYLKDGETLTQKYMVTWSDQNDAIRSQEIDIQIKGVADDEVTLTAGTTSSISFSATFRIEGSGDETKLEGVEDCKIYGNSGPDKLNLEIVSNSLIRTGESDDRIELQRIASSEIYADAGNDVFVIENQHLFGAYLWGGSGSDQFKITANKGGATAADVATIEDFDFASLADNGDFLSITFEKIDIKKLTSLTLTDPVPLADNPGKYLYTLTAIVSSTQSCALINLVGNSGLQMSDFDGYISLA